MEGRYRHHNSAAYWQSSYPSQVGINPHNRSQKQLYTVDNNHNIEPRDPYQKFYQVYRDFQPKHQFKSCCSTPLNHFHCCHNNGFYPHQVNPTPHAAGHIGCYPGTSITYHPTHFQQDTNFQGESIPSSDKEEYSRIPGQFYVDTMTKNKNKQKRKTYQPFKIEKSIEEIVHELDQCSLNQSHKQKSVRANKNELRQWEEYRNTGNLEVFENPSSVCGAINAMDDTEIRRRLGNLRLDQSGCKAVVNKRLKAHYNKVRTRIAGNAVSKKSLYDYLIYIDIEATCEEPNPKHFIHEIIEFPAVMVELKSGEVESEFHQYIKPKINPKLSDFCTSLTGIEQTTVDKADEFPQVKQRFESWLLNRKLGPSSSFAFVTDGSADFAKFFYMHCRVYHLDFPQYARRWINIKKLFSNFYKVGKCPLSSMLSQSGLAFEGKPNCGMDDARNISRLTNCIAEDGAVIHVNEYLIYNTRSKSKNQEKKKKAPTLDELWDEISIVAVTKWQARRFLDEDILLNQAIAETPLNTSAKSSRDTDTSEYDSSPRYFDASDSLSPRYYDAKDTTPRISDEDLPRSLDI